MVVRKFRNRDNWAFYDHMPLYTMREHYERKSGLVGAPDVSMLKPYWNDSKSILEIGAGEGRVIDGLLKEGFSGTIYALERSNTMCQELRRKYNSHLNVVVIEDDLLNAKHLPSVDAGLWLWSGIVEFNPKEQKKVIHKLRNHIRKILCFDTPVLGSKNNATEQWGNYCQLRSSWGETEQAYIPYPADVDSYIHNSGFTLNYSFDFSTAIDRCRTYYILK